MQASSPKTQGRIDIVISNPKTFWRQNSSSPVGPQSFCFQGFILLNVAHSHLLYSKSTDLNAVVSLCPFKIHVEIHGGSQWSFSGSD
jgi:hypothetical protein